MLGYANSQLCLQCVQGSSLWYNILLRRRTTRRHGQVSAPHLSLTACLLLTAGGVTIGPL